MKSTPDTLLTSPDANGFNWNAIGYEISELYISVLCSDDRSKNYYHTLVIVVICQCKPTT